VCRWLLRIVLQAIVVVVDQPCGEKGSMSSGAANGVAVGHAGSVTYDFYKSVFIRVQTSSSLLAQLSRPRSLGSK
jgi:uncharacterized membrane protein